MRFSYIIFLLSISFHIAGQTVISLGDLLPGSENSYPSEENNAIYFNEKLYFSANSDSFGIELMVYDGETTTIFKDISPGSESSIPKNFYIVNDLLLFNANDGEHGSEWWKTDGTVEGTQLVKDIFQGEEDGVWEGNSDPSTSFHLYKNELFFVGIDSNNDFELWKTDGTSEGTILLKNIGPDNTSFNQPSFPEGFVDFKGEVYFSCREGFWKTDGTTSGTVKIKSDHPDVFGFTPGSLYATSEYIIMSHNPGVWVSDGTLEGTVNIATLGQVNLNWTGNRFTQVGDIVLFPGDDNEHGNELWRSDGTAEGTHILVDLWEGENGYAPQNTTLFQGNYYYKGNNGLTGLELYTSDGTAEGTKLVKDIKAGGTGSMFLPSEIISTDEFIFFRAGKSFTKLKLWQSDGTAAGTTEVSQLGDAIRPISFYPFDGKLFFYALTDEHGFEPFIYDPFGVEIDSDNDGYIAADDCDDSDALVNPGQSEIPFNGKDDDCNAETLDNDGDQDGFSEDEDCDDSDPLINPDAVEIVNNDVDEDCNGEIGTSAVVSIDNYNISIYPNPVRDRIYIEIDAKRKLHFEVYNIIGKKVYSAYNPSFIDVQKWNHGQYFIKIMDEHNTTPIITKIAVQ